MINKLTHTHIGNKKASEITHSMCIKFSSFRLSFCYAFYFLMRLHIKDQCLAQRQIEKTLSFLLK